MKLIRNWRCSASCRSQLCFLYSMSFAWGQFKAPGCDGNSWFCARSPVWASSWSRNRGQHCLLDVCLHLGPRQLKWSVTFYPCCARWKHGSSSCLMLPSLKWQATGGHPFHGSRVSPFRRWGSASGHVWLERRNMPRLSIISYVMWW